MTDQDDVILVIRHSWADFEMPLTEWMSREGPGPRNAGPVSARSRSTGEPLPLTVIPAAYRHDRESRALIAAGRMASPWPDRSGESPPFDGYVADPAGADRRIRALLSGGTDFGDNAPELVRRLAAGSRWPEFGTFIGLAAAAGRTEIGPVLCELLDSSLHPPDRLHVVETLPRLGHDEAGDTLWRQLSHFVHVDRDLGSARRCLRAMAVTGRRCRAMLLVIAWERPPVTSADRWPAEIPRWAEEELSSVGAPASSFPPSVQ